MTKPTNRPTVVIPTENTTAFGQEAISAISVLHDVNQFIDESVTFQSGNILTPLIIKELQKPGNPLRVDAEGVAVPNLDTAGRIVIARDNNSYTTIDNRYPENDGGFTLRNQMLYSQTADIVRDFVVDDDLIDGSSASRYVRFVRGDGYRALRMAGVQTGTVSPTGGNPGAVQLPTAARGRDILLNMAVIVPDGGNFIFWVRSVAFAPLARDYVRISTLNEDTGQQIFGSLNENDNVGNFATEDRLNSGRNFLIDRVPPILDGGLYFLRISMSNDGTNDRLRFTASRFDISDTAIAFDRTNGFGSLDGDHPNYLGERLLTSRSRLDQAPREMYFSSHETTPCDLLFYQIQVGSAFNVIR